MNTRIYPKEDMATERLYEAMMAQANERQVEPLMRFFKCGPGEYGEGDLFLGIKMPVTRSVVKQWWGESDFTELQRCVSSPYHEIRMAALLTLIEKFSHAKKNVALQQQCIDFYLSHTQYINNWDLVDLSSYPLLGTWLLDKERTLLYNLVRNGVTLWEQRIGMVSTLQFIRHGQLDDTFALADLFIKKPCPLHDLLQKAVGWMLREAGKRDSYRLTEWLLPRAASLPRTMLRYAIEKYPEMERRQFLSI